MLALGLVTTTAKKKKKKIKCITTSNNLNILLPEKLGITVVLSATKENELVEMFYFLTLLMKIFNNFDLP